MTLNINQINKNHLNKEITLEGWIQSNRDSGKIGFISFNDGSSFDSFQLVYKDMPQLSPLLNGTPLQVTGTIVASRGQQEYEMVVKKFTIVNTIDADYPLQKKEHSPEFLRENAHLRSRTKTFKALWKVRSELNFLIHKFYNEQGFYHAAAPIITSNDCEGAGESFLVTNTKDNKIDFAKDFFKTKALLTVSGQLHGEAMAQALKNVYVFGPTFRAENSHTSRHVAEFWMLEPEIAFCGIEKIMQHGEDLVKYCFKGLLKNTRQELEFFAQKNNPDLVTNLEKIAQSEFKRVRYEQLVKKLQEAYDKGHRFEDNKIFVGMDFGSEHERYLCEQVYQGPVFATHYPKAIKAFYMKTSSDDTYVDSFDLLVPGIGELIGGSARENDPQLLVAKAKEKDVQIEELKWYVDLRRFGSAPSAGFGLGFERLLMYVTGLKNIRDALPFPRFPGSIKF